MNDMAYLDPEEPLSEHQEAIEASLTASEFFRTLEECDSKRVYDFWDMIDDTVLEILNWDGRKDNSSRIDGRTQAD